LVFGVEHLHYKYTKIMMLFVVSISVVLAVLTPFIGENVNGAVRAINFGFISVQAAEPCKLASAMLLAYVLSRFQKPDGTGLSAKGVWYGIATILMFFALLITQGGSNALLVLLVGGSLLVLAVLPRKVIWGGLFALAILIGIICLVISISNNKEQKDELVAQTTVVKEASKPKGIMKLFRSETWQNRIDDWLPDSIPEYEVPTSYAVGGNSQKHHAFMAIAHGNGIGVMPGNSRECSRLQLAFSDYIYAIILEELGLLGGGIVLLCYLGIIIRAIMISKKCKSAYASLLIMGMALVIVYQAFYHMCISVGVMPVSGQTLPFISKGGTSILVMSVAMGMMLSVSRFAVERTDTGLKTIDDDDELPDDLKADNPAGGF
jgi:cell division protein FtsW